MNPGERWQPVSAEQVGGSLCFTMAGSGSFAVVSAARSLTWLWIAGAALAAVVLVVLIAAGRRRKKAKRQPTAQGSAK